MRFERYRIQTIGRDDIAREWISYEPARLRRIGARRTGVINQFHLACSVEALREISRPLQRGRKRVRSQRRCQDALPFIQHEEKRPISPVINLRNENRPAGARAKLVALKARQRPAGPVGEKIVGIEKTVAQELKYAAVQIVCSGFRDQRHHTAATTPVLGGISVSLNLELLNPFHRWDRADGRDGGDVVKRWRRRHRGAYRWSIPARHSR